MLIGIDGNEANVRQRVGSNQYAFEIIKALYDLEDKNDYLVYLREKPLSDMPAKNDRWSYRVVGPKPFWTQWRLPLDLFLHRPSPQVFFSPGHYSPRWARMPRVISVMDLGFLRFPDQFTKRDFYQLSIWSKHSIKTASHVLAISESTKNDIIETYKIQPEKITVTYPGFDRTRFSKKINQSEIKEVKAKYHIKDKYLLFLSTLKPSKNIEGLLEALNILISQYPNIQLVIAGKKGWLYEKIFEKVKSLKLETKVIFTDFVLDVDIPALMAGAEVFVMPSFWEGFGITVVEAMACGVPVVVSKVGSLPEVIGDAGVVINPESFQDLAKGIEEAFENKEKLIEKGYMQIKKFSWDNCARQTLKILESFGR